jgi:small conductance mechanosensitive channel
MPEELAGISLELVQEFGINAALALVIFIVGRIVAKIVTSGVRKALARTEMEDTLERFLCNILYAVLMVVVVIATINQLGVQTTSLLAVLGAAGLAVGLALQGSLANFAAGVLIVGFRPYKVGDFIEAGGVSGTVEEVQIFTTVLKSPDNKTIIVPNSQVMAELADSSVNFVVRPWVKSADYWGVYFDLTETIKKRFDQEGIAIPYPQRDVHVYQHASPAG